MTHSMTGFGRGEAVLGEGGVTAEVRSVNTRHLDVRVRLPRELADLEGPVREASARFFSRGQVEVSVRLTADGALETELEIDVAAAGRYFEAARRLRDEFDLEGSLSLATLLGLPGVTRLRETDLDAATMSTAILEAVGCACQAALEMRKTEGAHLDRELRTRLDRLNPLLTQIEQRAEEVRQALRARLGKRVATLAPELELDPRRLDQEVVLYADRMDVTEETVRMRSHLEQFHETLRLEGPIGRKLEFLLQELNREVNTIGSKASDANISRSVVELKTELEKVREQVLNVE